MRPGWLLLPNVVLGGDPVTENGVMVADTAIWRDQLTPRERAELGRGAGVIPLRRPDILVAVSYTHLTLPTIYSV